MIVPSRELMPVIHAALQRGQRVRMSVNGSSMLPFLRDGDVVELEPVRTLPMPGDIMLVRGLQERYVLHRVVRIEGDALFLRGDAQSGCEGPFTRRDVLAKVVMSYPNGRARALDRGVWRLAGLLWTRCSPVGLAVLQVALYIRGVGRRALRRRQRW